MNFKPRNKCQMIKSKIKKWQILKDGASTYKRKTSHHYLIEPARIKTHKLMPTLLVRPRLPHGYLEFVAL